MFHDTTTHASHTNRPCGSDASDRSAADRQALDVRRPIDARVIAGVEFERRAAQLRQASPAFRLSSSPSSAAPSTPCSATRDLFAEAAVSRSLSTRPQPPRVSVLPAQAALA